MINLYLQISPAMSKSTAGYVHHLVAAYCADFNESHVGSQDCDDMTNSVTAGCTANGGVFTAWAVGGTVCGKVGMSL